MKPGAWVWCLLWRGHTPIRVIDAVDDVRWQVNIYGESALDFRVTRDHCACLHCGVTLPRTRMPLGPSTPSRHLYAPPTPLLPVHVPKPDPRMFSPTENARAALRILQQPRPEPAKCPCGEPVGGPPCRPDNPCPYARGMSADRWEQQ